MKPTKGILLVNLGTPDSPSVRDVRKYLFEFLNDPRVIDIPAIARWFLVNLIIVPFRAPKSAALYKLLWSEKGSPLLLYGRQCRDILAKKLGPEYGVHLAMRYGNPSIPSVVEEMRKQGYKSVKVIPMFPQYASSSTGSAIEKVMQHIAKWNVIPEVNIVSQFYNHPTFIEAWGAVAQEYDYKDYDHVLFSFHGLPVRHLDATYVEGQCADHDCEKEVTDENHSCYKAVCYETARLIAQKLGIPADSYTVCFQSRLGRDPWVEPYTDHVLKDRANKGDKKLLVFSPAFVADCLETTIEIGYEYQEEFEEMGGEKVQLVPSLNVHPVWIDCLEDLAKNA